MKIADTPAKFSVPFGHAAGPTEIRAIPTASLIGVDDGAASFETGFPPLTFTPLGAGGVPPDGRDMNGVLYAATAWGRWIAAGGQVVFDAAFASGIGGYPKGAILASALAAGKFFTSTVDDNDTDPDGVGAANWLPLAPVAATAPEFAGFTGSGFVTPPLLASLFPDPVATPSGYEWKVGKIHYKRVNLTVGANSDATATFTNPFPAAVLWADVSGGQAGFAVDSNDPTTPPGSWTVNNLTVHNPGNTSADVSVLAIGF